MTNTFLKNSFLPSDFEGYVFNVLNFNLNHTDASYRPGEYNLSTPVLVVSIKAPERVELPEDGTVSMSFALPMVNVIV